MTVGYKAIISELGQAKVKINESLASHTYMKVGGPADLFFVANSKEDLKRAVSAAIKHKVPYFTLGGGSNIVVRDKGIRGLVIKNRADSIKIVGLTGKMVGRKTGVKQVVVEAESGAIFNHLVRFTIEDSLEGLEEFLGVPGTVGGAVYNNSHYKDKMIGDYVKQVLVVDVKGKEKIYTQKQMKFSYDYSVLQQTAEVVLSVQFLLRMGQRKELWQEAEAVLEQRRKTQPLEEPSSGCMFKNIKEAEALLYNTPNQATAAGFLIDKAGLKGTQIGGAKVSEVHANFIVNTGSATAKDIWELSELVRKKVKNKYRVNLKREVFFVGEK